MNLADVAGSGLTITVNGKPWTVSPLTIGDFAKAESFIRSRRLDECLERTRFQNGVILPDEVRAKMLAEVATRTVTTADVLASSEGRLYITWLSIAKKTASAPTFDAFCGMADQALCNQLESLLRHVGGQESGGSDPTISTQNTTATE